MGGSRKGLSIDWFRISIYLRPSSTRPLKASTMEMVLSALFTMYSWSRTNSSLAYREDGWGGGGERESVGGRGEGGTRVGMSQ